MRDSLRIFFLEMARCHFTVSRDGLYFRGASLKELVVAFFKNK